MGHSQFTSAEFIKVLASREIKISMDGEPHRLTFIDETATNTKMTRLRGRAKLSTAA